MEIEHRSPNDVMPYEKNPRINDSAVDAVAASLKEFGFRQPIVIDEHGLIVVYYDKPGTEALETLTAWAQLYDAPWSGVVLTQKPGLGEALVLTAWNRLFRLERFDTAAAAAFIDAFRGRGPEKPVR